MLCRPLSRRGLTSCSPPLSSGRGLSVFYNRCRSVLVVPVLPQKSSDYSNICLPPHLRPFASSTSSSSSIVPSITRRYLDFEKMTTSSRNGSPGHAAKRQRTSAVISDGTGGSKSVVLKELEKGPIVRCADKLTSSSPSSPKKKAEDAEGSTKHTIIIAESKEAAEACAKGNHMAGVRADFKGAQLLPDGKTSCSVVVVPSDTSRHNSAARPDVVVKALQGDAVVGSSSHVGIIIASTGTPKDNIWALAAYKAFPACSLKSTRNEQTVTIVKPAKNVQVVGECVRAAQVLVDLPPSHLTASTYEDYIREVLSPYLSVSLEKVEGKELEKRGFGGIWAVGKGASFSEGRAPRMLVLKYPGSGDGNKPWKTLVGKGIIYDTGGLAIKGREGMCGMKRDMGGSAGVFGAFLSAVRTNIKENVCCILCIAENSVSAESFRNDDILHMYSGKTVEVNNTDAEGRIVLADGVAYAAKDLNSELILTMATLTGAQGIATGQLHGTLVTDSAEWEKKMVKAGEKSGDLVWPMPYVPENYMEEYKSAVADMKNSVANRANAQASCAGSFIRAHIPDSWTGGWVHVDMAYPSFRGERATGYGVALLAATLGVF
ncbi:unnamed protein product [Amoebophrya sp. A25]|nr:unnamed protein product [Amoebophrya sp. A25]|eukprot:GSA25T00005497001.1